MTGGLTPTIGDLLPVIGDVQATIDQPAIGLEEVPVIVGGCGGDGAAVEMAVTCACREEQSMSVPQPPPALCCRAEGSKDASKQARTQVTKHKHIKANKQATKGASTAYCEEARQQAQKQAQTAAVPD